MTDIKRAFFESELIQIIKVCEIKVQGLRTGKINKYRLLKELGLDKGDELKK